MALYDKNIGEVYEKLGKKKDFKNYDINNLNSMITAMGLTKKKTNEYYDYAEVDAILNKLIELARSSMTLPIQKQATKTRSQKEKDFTDMLDRDYNNWQSQSYNSQKTKFTPNELLKIAKNILHQPTTSDYNKDIIKGYSKEIQKMITEGITVGTNERHSVYEKGDPFYNVSLEDINEIKKSINDSIEKKSDNNIEEVKFSSYQKNRVANKNMHDLMSKIASGTNVIGADTETVVDKNGKAIPIQIALGEKMTMVRLDEAVSEHMKKLIDQAKSGKELNNSELASLRNLADIKEIGKGKNKQIVFNHREWGKDANILDIIKEVENGLGLISNNTTANGTIASKYANTWFKEQMAEYLNSIIAMANGRKFDIDALRNIGIETTDHFGKNNEKLLDTLEIARYLIPRGSKNSKNSKKLFNYQQEEIAKYLDVDLQAISDKFGGGVSHNADYDAAVVAEIAKKISSNYVNSIKNSNENNLNLTTISKALSGQIAIARDNIWANNGRSFRTNITGEPVLSSKENPDQMAKFIARAGSALKFHGATKNTDGSVSAKFTSLDDGTDAYFNFSDITDLEQFFTKNLDVKPKMTEDSYFADPKNAFSSIFGRHGYHNLEQYMFAANGSSSSSIHKKRYDTLKNNNDYHNFLTDLYTKMNSAKLSEEQRQILMEKTSNMLGIGSRRPINASSIQNYVSLRSGNATGSVAEQYKELISKLQKQKGIQNRKTILNRISQIQNNAHNRSSADDQPFYEVASLIAENMNSRGEKVFGNVFSPSSANFDFSKLKVDDLINDTLLTTPNRNTTAIRHMYNKIGSTPEGMRFRNFIDGTSTYNRFGKNSIIPHGLSNDGFAQGTMGRLLEQIENIVKSRGVGMKIKLSPDMDSLSVGLFDAARVMENNPGFSMGENRDAMAVFDIPLASKNRPDGVISVKGRELIDKAYIDLDKYGNPKFYTSTQEVLETLFEKMQGGNILYNILKNKPKNAEYAFSKIINNILDPNTAGSEGTVNKTWKKDNQAGLSNSLVRQKIQVKNIRRLTEKIFENTFNESKDGIHTLADAPRRTAITQLQKYLTTIMMGQNPDEIYGDNYAWIKDKVNNKEGFFSKPTNIDKIKQMAGKTFIGSLAEEAAAEGDISVNTYNRPGMDLAPEDNRHAYQTLKYGTIDKSNEIIEAREKSKMKEAAWITQSDVNRGFNPNDSKQNSEYLNNQTARAAQLTNKEFKEAIENLRMDKESATYKYFKKNGLIPSIGNDMNIMSKSLHDSIVGSRNKNIKPGEFGDLNDVMSEIKKRGYTDANGKLINAKYMTKLIKRLKAGEDSLDMSAFSSGYNVDNPIESIFKAPDGSYRISTSEKIGDMKGAKILLGQDRAFASVLPDEVFKEITTSLFGVDKNGKSSDVQLLFEAEEMSQKNSIDTVIGKWMSIQNQMVAHDNGDITNFKEMVENDPVLNKVIKWDDGVKSMVYQDNWAQDITGDVDENHALVKFLSKDYRDEFRKTAMRKGYTFEGGERADRISDTYVNSMDEYDIFKAQGVNENERGMMWSERGINAFLRSIEQEGIGGNFGNLTQLFKNTLGGTTGSDQRYAKDSFLKAIDDQKIYDNAVNLTLNQESNLNESDLGNLNGETSETGFETIHLVSGASAEDLKKNPNWLPIEGANLESIRQYNKSKLGGTAKYITLHTTPLNYGHNTSARQDFITSYKLFTNKKNRGKFQDKFLLPITSPENYKIDGRPVENEVGQNIDLLLKEAAIKTSGSKGHKFVNLQKRLEDTYLATDSYFKNKDYKGYKDLHTFRVGSSMTAAISNVGILDGDENSILSNTVVMSPEDYKKDLTLNEKNKKQDEIDQHIKALATKREAIYSNASKIPMEEEIKKKFSKLRDKTLTTQDDYVSNIADLLQLDPRFYDAGLIVRYPETGGYDRRFVRIKLNKDAYDENEGFLSSGVMGISKDLADYINADFDGDHIQQMIFASNAGLSEAEYSDALKSQFDLTNSQTERSMMAYDYLTQLEDQDQEKVIGALKPDKKDDIGNAISVAKDYYDTEKGKQVALNAKHNKSGLGMVSLLSEGVKRALESNGDPSHFDPNDVSDRIGLRFLYGGLNAIEQVFISSKKLRQEYDKHFKVAEDKKEPNPRRVALQKIEPLVEEASKLMFDSFASQEGKSFNFVEYMKNQGIVQEGKPLPRQFTEPLVYYEQKVRDWLREQNPKMEEAEVIKQAADEVYNTIGYTSTDATRFDKDSIERFYEQMSVWNNRIIMTNVDPSGRTITDQAWNNQNRGGSLNAEKEIDKLIGIKYGEKSYGEGESVEVKNRNKVIKSMYAKGYDYLWLLDDLKKAGVNKKLISNITPEDFKENAEQKYKEAKNNKNNSYMTKEEAYELTRKEFFEDAKRQNEKFIKQKSMPKHRISKTQASKPLKTPAIKVKNNNAKFRKTVGLTEDEFKKKRLAQKKNIGKQNRVIASKAEEPPIYISSNKKIDGGRRYRNIYATKTGDSLNKENPILQQEEKIYPIYSPENTSKKLSSRVEYEAWLKSQSQTPYEEMRKVSQINKARGEQEYHKVQYLLDQAEIAFPGKGPDAAARRSMYEMAIKKIGSEVVEEGSHELGGLDRIKDFFGKPHSAEEVKEFYIKNGILDKNGSLIEENLKYSNIYEHVYNSVLEGRENSVGNAFKDKTSFKVFLDTENGKHNYYKITDNEPELLGPSSYVTASSVAHGLQEIQNTGTTSFLSKFSEAEAIKNLNEVINGGTGMDKDAVMKKAKDYFNDSNSPRIGENAFFTQNKLETYGYLGRMRGTLLHEYLENLENQEKLDVTKSKISRFNDFSNSIGKKRNELEEIEKYAEQFKEFKAKLGLEGISNEQSIGIDLGGGKSFVGTFDSILSGLFLDFKRHESPSYDRKKENVATRTQLSLGVSGIRKGIDDGNITFKNPEEKEKALSGLANGFATIQEFRKGKMQTLAYDLMSDEDLIKTIDLSLKGKEVASHPGYTDEQKAEKNKENIDNLKAIAELNSGDPMTAKNNNEIKPGYLAEMAEEAGKVNMAKQTSSSAKIYNAFMKSRNFFNVASKKMFKMFGYKNGLNENSVPNGFSIVGEKGGEYVEGTINGIKGSFYVDKPQVVEKATKVVPTGQNTNLGVRQIVDGNSKSAYKKGNIPGFSKGRGYRKAARKREAERKAEKARLEAIEAEKKRLEEEAKLVKEAKSAEVAQNTNSGEPPTIGPNGGSNAIEPDENKYNNQITKGLSKSTDGSSSTSIKPKDFLKINAKGLFKTMRGSLSYSIVSEVITAFKKIAAEIKILDDAMVNLRIVTGATKEESYQMISSYAKLGKELGVTTSEITTAANGFLRMGMNAKDTGQLIKDSMTLSKVGMMEAGKAQEYLTSAMKGYKLGAKDMSGVVDMATSLDMKYAVDAGYIFEAMSRAANSAKNAKIEMSELQSMIAVAGEVTQFDASMVGTGIRTSLARYGNVKSGAYEKVDPQTLNSSEDTEAVNDIEKVLNKKNIKIREADGKTWKSYTEVLKEVSLQWKSMSDLEKNAIATSMFGTRQREIGLTILDNYNRVLTANELAVNSSGNAARKMKVYQDGLEATTKKLTATWESFVNNLQGQGAYSNVLKFFTSLVSTLNDVSVIAGKITSTFGNFGTIIGKQSDNKWGSRIGGTTGNILSGAIGTAALLGGSKLFSKVTAGNNGIEKVNGLFGAVGSHVQNGKFFNTEKVGFLKRLDNRITNNRVTDWFKRKKPYSVYDKEGQPFMETQTTVNEQGEETTRQTGKQVTTNENDTKKVASQKMAGAMAIGGTILGNIGASNIREYSDPDNGLAKAGAIAGSIGPILASTMGLPGVGLAIGGLTAVIGAAMKAEAQRVQRLADKADELKESLNKATSSKEDAKRYDELVKGIDNRGNNLSLSEDEYSELTEISNRLAEVFPEMVTYVDEAGNSFLGLNGKIGTLADGIQDLIKAKKKESAEASLNADVWKKNHSEALKEMQKSPKEYKDIFSVEGESSEYSITDVGKDTKKSLYGYNFTDKNGAMFISQNGEEVPVSELKGSYFTEFQDVLKNNGFGNFQAGGNNTLVFDKELSSEDKTKIDSLLNEYVARIGLKADSEKNSQFRDAIKVDMPDLINKNAFDKTSEQQDALAQIIYGAGSNYQELLGKGGSEIIGNFMRSVDDNTLNTITSIEKMKDTTGSADQYRKNLSSQEDGLAKVMTSLNTNPEFLELMGWNEGTQISQKALMDLLGIIDVDELGGKVVSKLGNENVNKDEILQTYSLEELKEINNMDAGEVSILGDKLDDVLISKMAPDASSAVKNMSAKLQYMKKDRNDSNVFATSNEEAEEFIKNIANGTEKVENLPLLLQKTYNNLKQQADQLGMSVADFVDNAEYLAHIDINGFSDRKIADVKSNMDELMSIRNQLSQNGGILDGASFGTMLEKFGDDALIAMENGINGSGGILDIIKKGIDALDKEIVAIIKTTFSGSEPYFQQILDQLNPELKNMFEDSGIKNYDQMLKNQTLFGDSFKNGNISVKEVTNGYNSQAVQDTWYQNLAKTANVTEEFGTDAFYNKIYDSYLSSGYYQGSDVANLQAKSARTTLKDKKAFLKQQQEQSYDLSPLVKVISKGYDKMAKTQAEQIDASGRAKENRDAHEAYYNVLKSVKDQKSNRTQNQINRSNLGRERIQNRIENDAWGLDVLDENDFEGRQSLMQDQVSAYTSDLNESRKMMEELKSITPQTSAEAKTLADQMKTLGESIRSDSKAMSQLKDQMRKNYFAEINKEIGKMNKSLERQSKIIESISAYGDSGDYSYDSWALLGLDFSGIDESDESLISQKRDEYTSLIGEQESYNDQSLTMNREYLDLLETEQNESLQIQLNNFKNQFPEMYNTVQPELAKMGIAIDENLIQKIYGARDAMTATGSAIKNTIAEISAEMNGAEFTLPSEYTPPVGNIPQDSPFYPDLPFYLGGTGYTPPGFDQIRYSGNSLIPQNAQGTSYFKGGLTSIAEQGREIFITPDGKMFIANSEDIIGLQKGTKIYNNRDTEKMLRTHNGITKIGEMAQGTLNNPDLNKIDNLSVKKSKKHEEILEESSKEHEKIMEDMEETSNTEEENRQIEFNQKKFDNQTEFDSSEISRLAKQNTKLQRANSEHFTTEETNLDTANTARENKNEKHLEKTEELAKSIEDKMYTDLQSMGINILVEWNNLLKNLKDSVKNEQGDYEDTGELITDITKFFKSAGFSNEGIAAILGNLQAESSMNPKAVNNVLATDGKKYTGEEYTKLVDSGEITKEQFANDKRAYGLPQFYSASYKESLWDLAHSSGKSISDPGLQLQVLMGGLQTRGVLNEVKNATDVKSATKTILVKYEAPGEEHASYDQQNEVRSKYAYGYLPQVKAVGGPKENAKSVDGKYNPIGGGYEWVYSSTFANHIRGGRSTGVDLAPNGDLAREKNIPVQAIYPGMVRSVSTDPHANAGGYYVIIEDNQGRQWGYMHFKQKALVEPGQKIKIGDKLGYVGNTGKSSGPHLHIQIKNPNGSYVNPESYIAAYATGTNNHPGGMALVGEEGPELVNLPKGSQVLPADKTDFVLNNRSYAEGTKAFTIDAESFEGIEGVEEAKNIIGWYNKRIGTIDYWHGYYQRNHKNEEQAAFDAKINNAPNIFEKTKAENEKNTRAAFMMLSKALEQKEDTKKSLNDAIWEYGQMKERGESSEALKAMYDVISTLDNNLKELKTTIEDLSKTIVDNASEAFKKLKEVSEVKVNNEDFKLQAGLIRSKSTRYQTEFGRRNYFDYKKDTQENLYAEAVNAYNTARRDLKETLKGTGEYNTEEELQNRLNTDKNLLELERDIYQNQVDLLGIYSEENEYLQEQYELVKSITDMGKPQEWANFSQIDSYYNTMISQAEKSNEAIMQRLAQPISEEEYNKLKQDFAQNNLDKLSNELAKIQDKQSLMQKQYEAMTYMAGEYTTAINEQKDIISERYDEEINKLKITNDAKERSIKLTELQDNLDKAHKEKKRVYRAGVGFVYEESREDVKKAEDELKAFYREDQISSLEKAKEMELKVMDDRIQAWERYLNAIEKVYNTAERRENMSILNQMLGTKDWKGIWDVLNTDLTSFTTNWDKDMRIYGGRWTGFLEDFETISADVYENLKAAVDVLKDLPSMISNPSMNVEENKYGMNWREIQKKYGFDNFQEVLDKDSSGVIQKIMSDTKQSKEEVVNMLKTLRDNKKLEMEKTNYLDEMVEAYESGDREKVLDLNKERNQKNDALGLNMYKLSDDESLYESELRATDFLGLMIEDYKRGDYEKLSAHNAARNEKIDHLRLDAVKWSDDQAVVDVAKTISNLNGPIGVDNYTGNGIQIPYQDLVMKAVDTVKENLVAPITNYFIAKDNGASFGNLLNNTSGARTLDKK